MEATALPNLGMPKGAFRMVLHDDQMLETTSRILEYVEQDAAHQAAFEDCMARHNYGNTSWEWLKMREHGTYIMEGFPEAMVEIARNESLVEFNFDLSGKYDVRKIAEERDNWSWYDWNEDDVRQSHNVEFKTEAPLPAWTDLRDEHVLSDAMSLASLE